MRWVSAAVVVAVALSYGQVAAYEPETHREIAQRAVQPDASGVDSVLKSQLGVTAGILETFLGRQAQQWLGEGADKEDVPFFRSLHHFHNPLAAQWDDAGLASGLLRGQSSVLWQQNPGQNNVAGGGDWAWRVARQRYRDALTGETAGARERAFADTFRALGQLAHIVQDASVPAHVRNDPHLPGNSDGYEKWVEATRTKTRQLFEDLLNAQPVRPPTAIFTPTGHPLAPVPAARLIDSDKFRTPEDVAVLTSATLGVAEYTNGNFLSQDTIFSPFVLPRPPGQAAEFFEPEGGHFRRYFRKDQDGEQVEHFVAEGMLFESIPPQTGVPRRGKWVLNRRVHQDYAAKLLPHAVGYSAALLDYFFRGQLRAVPFWNRRGIRLDIQNLTSETMRGVFELHAIRQGGQQEKVATFGSDAAPLTLGPFGRTEVGLPTTFSPAKRFALVFQGQLGDERPDPSRDFIGGGVGVIFDIEFVFTVQDTFDGPMAQAFCEPPTGPPAGALRGEGQECLWLPQTVQMTGRFLTTLDRPIIQRIQLGGGGSRLTVPRLLVDGVLQPGGQWVRRNPTEPDPRTFTVEQVSIDMPPFYDLDVTTENRTTFETELAVIALGGGSAGKSLFTDRDAVVSGPERFLVVAGRDTFVSLDIEDSTRDWREAQFRAREISGSPNPTARGQRTFGPVTSNGFHLTFPEGVRVDEDSYDQDVIDHFEIFFLNDPNIDAAYDALPGVAAFVDPILETGPPDVTWAATVERDYRATELQFFQLFQIEPIFYTTRLRGE